MRVSEESGIEYSKTHWILATFARILHSTSYFFIILFPTAFYDRSRMTGRYLLPFCKKLSAVSAPTCPFRRLRRHLSQDKASHTLLQRRSAPRKVVRLRPVIRGRLTFPMLSFLGKKSFIASLKRNSLLPSFLSGG